MLLLEHYPEQEVCVSMVTAGEWGDNPNKAEVCSVFGYSEKATSRCCKCSRQRED